MLCREAIKKYGKTCKRICNAYSENRGVTFCMATVLHGMDAVCTRSEELKREAKYDGKD